MQSLLDNLEQHVAPRWELPGDADPSDVEMDFAGGATVSGDDELETRELPSGDVEFTPAIGPNAPQFEARFQVVELRWDPPGDDRGRSERRLIRAAATLQGPSTVQGAGAKPHTAR